MDYPSGETFVACGHIFVWFYFQFSFFKDQKRNDKTLYIEAHRSGIPLIRRYAFENGISSEIIIENLQR